MSSRYLDDMEKSRDPEAATLTAANSRARGRPAGGRGPAWPAGGAGGPAGRQRPRQRLVLAADRQPPGHHKACRPPKARPGQPAQAREVATMQPTQPIPRTVHIARPAGLACTKGRWEASRLHHAYVGPEHLLLGLLRQGDNPAARVLVAHGLDLETVRAEVDRLIAQGVLPGPPSQAELRRQQELQARWLDTQDLTPEERAQVERLIA